MEDHAYHQVSTVGVKRMPEADLNGSSKRMSYASSEHGDIVFRILCPGTKTGSIIGKAGSIIKQIRDETGARIKVADAVPGVEERAVIVSGPETPGTDFCPAQQALFRVHQRIIEPDGGDEHSSLGSITTRLLVPSSQIGCILGKQGSIIAEMRAATGAQIRILPKDQLPGCALPSDETLQLVGEVASVKAALSDVSSRLRANPPRDRSATQAYRGQPIGLGGGGGLHSAYGGTPLGNPSLSSSAYGSQPPSAWGYSAAPLGVGSASYGAGIPVGGPPPPPPVGPAVGGEVIFRLLCPGSKVGSIIGKGGSIIKQLRDLTGARIRVEDAVGDSEERVITITGVEEPGAGFSPAQEGLFHVHARVMDVTATDPPQAPITTTPGGKDSSSAATAGPSARLLVPTTQIGCILGKRGSIIAEIRRTTGAVVRILARDQLPQCAAESDELLQVMGSREKIHEALRQIAMRLRANAPRDPQSSSQHPAPQGPSHSALLGSVSLPSGYGGDLGFPQHGAIGVTTLNVAIPSSAVGTLIGKGGENIKKIRSLSGAKVRLLETDGGLQALERTVEISGSDEQMKMAHDLVQAFIAQAATGPLPIGLGGSSALPAGMGPPSFSMGLPPAFSSMQQY